MCENCRNDRLARAATLLGVLVIVLALPAGLMAGMLLGLVSDFGVSNTVENIRANPERFANQLAGLVVYSGWTALVSFFAPW